MSGVSVTVKHTGTATNATIYSDEGVTAISNPVSTDSNGRFAFYAADGRYDLVVGSPVNTTITDIADTDPGRVYEVILNDEAWVGLLNARYDRVGAVWNRRDVAKNAYGIKFDRVTDKISFMRAVAAANPIIWIEQGSISPSNFSIFSANAGTGSDITNTVTETDLYSVSLPQNTLTVGRNLRLLLWCDLLNNAAGTLRIRAKLGVTTYYDTGALTWNINASRQALAIDIGIGAIAVNSQVYMGGIKPGPWATQTALFGATPVPMEPEYFAVGSSAEDNGAGAKTLAVSAQWSVASASLAVRRLMAKVIVE